MQKNIIFNKNFQNQNGVNINVVSATEIVTETISQSGNLDISGNLLVSNTINNLYLNQNSNGAIYLSDGLSNFNTMGGDTIAIGKNPLAYVGSGSGLVSIGSYTFGYGAYTNCVGIGYNAMRNDIGGSYNTGIGYQASSDGLNSYNFSTAIGAKSTYTGSHQVVLGTPTETTIIKGNLAVGGITSVSSPYIVDISGSMIINGNLNVSGNVIASSYTTTSDRRIKNNISQITETIDFIQPRKYYNKLTNKEEFGVIADEIEEIFPNLVNGGGDELKSVNYIQLIALLIKEVKELKQKLNQI